MSDERSRSKRGRSALLCAALAASSATAEPSGGAVSAPPVPPPERQIAAALQAAPEERRAGARVLGYAASGELVELRAGTNDLVCLADDPRDEKFSAACYHAALEPFMRRGRELRAQGLAEEERQKRRFEEAEAGTLAMPKSPATLYVLTGSGFDEASGTVRDPYLRWVIYTPWATPEATGLPLAPTAPGAPWLMFPGTPGAHIMITPPKPEAQASPGERGAHESKPGDG
jgi:hypothetical protein